MANHYQPQIVHTKNNLIHNAPVTIDDVNPAQQIYGTNISLLKGKMTCQIPKLKALAPPIVQPTMLLKYHPYELINMDFLFVNGKPYLHIK